MRHIGWQSFIRFLLVGGSATLLHYAIMAILLFADWMSAGAASATGYSLSTLYNYAANARFTFAGKHDHRRSLPRFLLTALSGLGINQLILLSLLHLGLPLVLAQITATGGVLVWNYVVNATWSFRSRNSS